jgi:hypothetical protein
LRGPPSSRLSSKLSSFGNCDRVVLPERHTTSAPAAARPAAVLDGAYRDDLDLAKATVNGAPNPQSNVTKWWAFRSVCTAAGCVATGVRLDDNNHQSAITPPDTAALNFVEGHWQAAPSQRQVQNPECLGPNGTVVAGEDTQTVSWSLEPQPNGTLRSAFSGTVLTNACGSQGAVVQNTAVLTRVGDVPPSVALAEPSTVTPSPTPSPPAPAVAGPVLDGTYRMDIDPGDDPTTSWWGFRSVCTAAGCVAAGSRLADINHHEATGDSHVFHFADGHWQDTPYLKTGAACPHQNATFAGTQSWSLEPQADGTLRGTSSITVLTNGCGNGGAVFQSPMVATRTGDLAPTVTVADPALFEAPTPGG